MVRPVTMIINADDFGASSSVTAAILESFRRKLCSSTTLMTNMPGTVEACELAHDWRLLEHIGLHLVLDAGEPLTDDIRKCPRFCDGEGRLHFERRLGALRLDTSEKLALAGEIRAQIARARGLGIPLTHLDSHHHVHTDWAVGGVVMAVCRDEKIPFVRLARSTTGTPARWLYKQVYNRRLRRYGLDRTRHFGAIDDFVQQIGRKGAVDVSLEIMVHPVYGDNGQIFDSAKGGELASSLARLDGYEQAESFSGRCYEP